MLKLGFKRVLMITACTAFISLGIQSSVDAQERAYGERWGLSLIHI